VKQSHISLANSGTFLSALPEKQADKVKTAKAAGKMNFIALILKIKIYC
jgi:hypothetical protein